MKMIGIILTLLMFVTTFQGLISAEKPCTRSESDFIKKKYYRRLVLVTGCARSGTTFMSEFLCKNGLDVPHENIGKDGSVSWPMAVDDIVSPWGPCTKDYEFDHVFLQLRNPLKVISSVYVSEPPQSWAYICQHIKEIKKRDSHLTRCVKYWIYWNLKAEEKADFIYQIEKLEGVVGKMSAILQRPLDKKLVSTISKNTNTRYFPDKKEFTWKELKQQLDPDLYKLLKEVAWHYGYSVK